jgi:class 3 adenylate cyclase
VAVERALLLIADIGGYTRFMRLHRMSLAHSEAITGRLLEAVVEAVPQLRLVEIEGDAAFLYAPHKEADETSAAQATAALAFAMHHAFHARQQWMRAANMCSCPGCKQAGQLKVKFVAHIGEVAAQTVLDRTKIVGVDVIAVHRMLKNAVPVPEYLLMSEPVYEGADPTTRGRATGIELELEGLGSVKSYFVDIDEVALPLPPPPRLSLPRRLKETLGVVLPAAPVVLGLRKPRSAAPSES